MIKKQRKNLSLYINYFIKRMCVKINFQKKKYLENMAQIELKQG